LAVGLLSIPNTLNGGPPETELAGLGSPTRLEIRGADTFQADEIRQRLLADLDVSNARYLTTSLTEFCSLLAAKTREGYLCAGFADVTVSAAANAASDGIEITIVEGKRYLAGEIEVRGAKTIDAETLVADLTIEPAPVSVESVFLPGGIVQPTPVSATSHKSRLQWQVGQTAELNKATLGRLRDQIEAKLLERGHVGAQFNLEIVPDRERAVATLIVAFADEGTAAVVGEISVTGNKKNSREDVLAFLGLQAGMPYLGDLDSVTRWKLWESGRFIRSKVEVVKPSSPGNSLKLAIDLKEYENAPPLNQELSREESALVRLGRWLRHFDQSHEEVVLKSEDEAGVTEVAIASGRGVVAVFRSADDKESALPFALAFVMTDKRIGLYSAPTRRKIEAVPTPGRVVANISITIHDGPPMLTGGGNLTFGFGLNAKGKTLGLFRTCFGDTPVSMLSLAKEYDSKLSWKDESLRVAYRGRELSLDAATGALSEFNSRSDDGTVLTRTKGEFERRLKEIDVAALDFSQGGQSEGPFTAALDLYCDTGLTYLTKTGDVDDRKWVSLLRKLSRLGILEPFDRLALAACHAPNVEFYIPDDRVGMPISNGNGEPNVPALKYVCGYAGIEYADLLAAPGSWPWRMWRETMFALAGKSRHLERELVEQLSDPDSGAVRHLIVGQLLRANNMTAMARVFGLAGQGHLTDEDFRRDYAALLDGNTFVGHCLLTWADAIRHLNEAEIQTLCKVLVGDEWLDQGDAHIFADLARRLRRNVELPVGQALSAALDAWWKAGLRSYVKKELQALATEPKPDTASGQLIAADNGWRYRWHQGRWWYYGENGSWRYWTGRAWTAYSPATARRPSARR
jgi:hypothetical protein